MSTFYGYEDDETVTKEYVDKIDERVVNKDGFLRTDINMGARLISRNTVPVLDTELVNKKYVDSKFKQVPTVIHWQYTNLRGTTSWPRNPVHLWPSSPLFVNNVTSNAYISIVNLVTDNDGSGLVSNAKIELYIRYVCHDGTNTQTTHEKLIFTFDLTKYTKYTISDGQGVLHCVSINHDYSLNQLTDYDNIKLIYIGLKQVRGANQGNECVLTVTYNDTI